MFRKCYKSDCLISILVYNFLAKRIVNGYYEQCQPFQKAPVWCYPNIYNYKNYTGKGHK